ncbi:MAG: PAS domain S-box protein [Nitrospirota bacterium]|nr:MAG: PAS domain S-box protein [Nitrospirota bacterium]
MRITDAGKAMLSENPSGKMAQQLRANEKLFQAVVQTATDAIIMWDQHGAIVLWNKGARTMFGYAAAEIVGKPLTLIMPLRYHQAHHYGMERVETQGEGRTVVKTVELHGLRKNGEEFPIELSPSKSAIEDEILYCGIIRDISERKQAERALKERNHLLAFEAEIGHVLNRSQGPGDLWQACADAMVRHLDAGLAGIWTLESQQKGLELQASAGLYAHVTSPHGPAPFGHQQIGQIAFEKKPYLTNAVMEDSGVPEQVWATQEGLMAFVGYPLLIHHEVVGVMAMYFRRPVTNFTWHSLGIVADRIAAAMARHRAIEAYQSLAKHNERILTSSGEGIYGLDVEGKLTFVNPAGAHMLGYRIEELLGGPMHELIHHTKPDGSFYPRDDCPFNAALTEGAVHHNETEIFWRKDGTSFPVDCSVSPIVEDGQRTGAVVTFQDISERIRMTAELLEETKLAGVTMMLGDIAHDIKNMLMPVLSGAKLLDEELLDHYGKLPDVTPEQVVVTRKFSREAIDMIVNNARRIQGRMREIADTVKGLSSPLRFAPCQVSEVVTGVFDILRFYATETGVSLHTRGLDALPPIQADENRLFNALYNLVNNAIPETPDGGSVTVTGAVESDGTTVVISVIDTGNGMSPEIRDRLFTKDAISGKAGGTGLGTKIVKDVVDAHGGVITVNSEQGKGTTFTIHLPINPQTDALAE